jgi:hypothetical protein
MLVVLGGLPSVYAQQIGKPREFFAADYQKKVGGIVKADNSLEMQLEIQDIHDAQALPGGNWLLQTKFTEVIEVNPKGEELWRYTPSSEGGRVEIHSFRRLSNGLTMIAESGPSRIIEVDGKGKVQHTIPLKVAKSDPHRDTRLVRVTPDGNYLVAHEGEKTIREYNRKGEVVWEYEVGSQLYSAVRLENGNTLIGAGDGHRVVEVNKEKKVVWEIGEKDLPEITLAWITMVDRLENGNTWIVNCHAGHENPQIIEVTPDKKVVWTFKDFDRFGNALPVAVLAGQ